MVFKKIFIKLMSWMDEYYSRDERKEIELLKGQVKENQRLFYEVRKRNVELDNKIKILKVELSEMTIEKNKFKKDYDHCIIELLSVGEPEVKKPDWLVGYMKYKPKRRFVSKTMDVTLPFDKPQHCFDKSTVLYDLLKKNNLLNVEKTYDNMKKIQRLITNMITYEYDKTDNWRSISDVLIFKRGDCEDSGGIAITSALGMAGWKADEVFTWAGWYYRKGKSIDPNNKFGHAWCVIKCNDKWYVLEGTDKRAAPRLWEVWKDKYVGIWGGCNWKFEGMIKGGKTYM